jgi:hypothetical protein
MTSELAGLSGTLHGHYGSGFNEVGGVPAHSVTVHVGCGIAQCRQEGPPLKFVFALCACCMEVELSGSLMLNTSAVRVTSDVPLISNGVTHFEKHDCPPFPSP